MIPGGACRVRPAHLHEMLFLYAQYVADAVLQLFVHYFATNGAYRYG